ncbi:MAG: lipopolysaccharide heptosyltransferase II [Isosphaeraceae bacterium]
MSGAGGWNGAEHVLCVRLDALGDVLMTTPALRAIKESHPSRRITLLTSPAGAEAARLVPEVDHVLVYESPWMKATPPRPDSHVDRRMVKTLRRARVDAAAIFTVYSQNPLPAALLCYFAEIPLRLAHCRENPYQLLTDWVPDPEPDRLVRHEVVRQLDLVRSVGCEARDLRMSLRFSASARDRVSARLRRLELDTSRPGLVIHPGATASSRRYPPESFAAAARRLVLDVGMQVIFTGSESERPLIEAIRAEMREYSHSLAGQLDLEELAALIARAPLLISNNTGPVHIAAAVGTAVVTLYALTNPQHTPWQVPHRLLFHDVPCRYCYKSVCPHGHHDCLRQVPPEAVVEAVWSLLAEQGRLRRGEAADLRLPIVNPFETNVTG